MRILLWHVHGSWTTSFVHGGHTYLVPVNDARDADGRGRAQTYPWPGSAVEVPPEHLRGTEVDLVVLQRPHELDLAERWLGRRPGTDVPAVYVEHDTPRGPAASTRHPLADRANIPVVHVTPFNSAFWDCGSAPTTVVEHGVVDPGRRCTAELPRAGVVVNEPVRRHRITGADLLAPLSEAAPVDVFGMGTRDLPGWLGVDEQRVCAHDDVPQAAMHGELARRRVYVHPFRWTSLGLALIEAMHLGIPVVALAATEAVEAVPPEAGVVSTRVEVLADAVRTYAHEPELALRSGHAARQAARQRYGLERFLDSWDRVIKEVVR